MSKSVKLCFTALTAALLLASAVATTSARNFSVTNQNIRSTWPFLTFSGGVGSIECSMTVEGSFHARTIVKAPGTLIGAITKAIVKHPCTNGEAWTANGVEAAALGRLANTLPWHLTYERFRGTLPDITSIFLLLSRFRLVVASGPAGFDCIGQYGNATDNLTISAFRNLSGALTTLGFEGGRSTLVAELGFPGVCPATGTLEGSAFVMLLGSTTRVTVTLI
jgi:hypothetical protein